MTNISLELEEDDHLQVRALTMTDRASALIIADQPSLATASEFLLAIKDLRNEAEAHHRPMIDAAHKSWKAALEGLRLIDEPLARAEATVKPKISAYLAEQKRLADEARRIEEERLRKEEAERLRLQEEALERDIEAAEAAGASPQEIEAIIDQTVSLPAAYQAPRAMPAPQPIAPKGIASRETWSAEVTDLRKLCGEIAAGRQPLTLVTANMTALNQMARALKASLNIPGVRAVSTSSIAAGRR